MVEVMYKPRCILAIACTCLVLLGTGCSAGGDGSGAYKAPKDERPGGGAADAGTGSDNNGDTFVPEDEEEFEFSAPAVVGDSIFVANETLDSVAVIDSQTLAIDTLLVGFRPTDIVGPDPEHADSKDARVMVLNKGGGSVSVIDPASREVKTRPAMRLANSLKMDPTGRFGVVWYDDTRQKATDKAGDLSSVSVVTKEATYQVAVGFHVRDVFFDEEGERAIVWTDDGVSAIDLTSLGSDTVAAPVALVPSSLDVFRPADLEIQTTDDAKYVVTRSAEMRGVVLLDIDKRDHHVVPLPEVPTDVDLIAGQTPRALVMLRASNRAVRADIPGGFVDAAEALKSKIGEVPVGKSPKGNGENRDTGVSMGMSDTGGDVEAIGDTFVPDAATDTGVAVVDATGSDAGSGGGSDASTDASDAVSSSDGAGAGDAGDTASQADTALQADTSDAEVDTGPSTPFFPGNISGFDVIDVKVDQLGAAEIGKTSKTALLYTTVGSKKRIVLYDLAEGEQRVVRLEKEVRGAISDDRGKTFIVYNEKQPGQIPASATPADPEYVARKYGLTLIDIDSKAKRLILTDQKPGPAALWSPDKGDSKVYVIFEPPAPMVEQSGPELRDVIEANLQTFRTRTHRLPSIPEGLGPIRPAEKVFISQRHPQGRMTFIDTTTAERQTITGYQLNSKIE